MTDREKVIKGLECCLDNDGCYTCDKCPYAATDEERKHVGWNCHEADLQKDALELLKEQELVVRCKDCKHHRFHPYEKIPYCGKHSYGWGWKDDDFCSHAERR